MNRNINPASPLPGLGIEGYPEEARVHPGGSLRFMLSGPNSHVTLKIVRMQHGDPNPTGPGFRAVPVCWGAPSDVVLLPQHTDTGSYVEFTGEAIASLNPGAEFTLGLWFLPTRMGGWQALAAKFAADDLGFGIFCCGLSGISAFVSHDGARAQWLAGKGFVDQGRWQYVALAYDGTNGKMRLFQLSSEPPPRIAEGSTTIGFYSSEAEVPSRPIHQSRAPLLLGAALGEQGHHLHFNGKLAEPVMLGASLSKSSVTALSAGADPTILGPVLGAWDFSLDVTSDRVIDTSLKPLHGRAVNAPARAVTGPRWNGVHSSQFTDDPTAYRAIHLHDDDLDDARWDASFEVSVPQEAASGVYGALLESDRERLILPFVVADSRPAGELLVLLPTFTWQAYNTNQQAWGITEDGVLDSGLSIYDRHSDGSPVYYCTRRKPTRSADPTRGFRLWGAHLHTANLYLLDWLDKKTFEYDVITDEDLDQNGQDVLNSCRCLVLSGHPEYFTHRMMSAVKTYARSGGRIVYLAGNGLYWVTSVDPQRPYVIEVRKSGDGDIADWARAAPGEVQHSSTLELGGLWSRRGLPPRSIVGVEYGCGYFPDVGERIGYQRLPASHDSKYAFIFEGVANDVIGDFGLNMGTSSGYEMDCVQEWDWEGDGPVVLARAKHSSFMPLMNAPCAPVADISLLEYPNGGAVFAAGAVTWTGSLSHNNYENDVSHLTSNVLRRFLTTPTGESVCGAE